MMECQYCGRAEGVTESNCVCNYCAADLEIVNKEHIEKRKDEQVRHQREMFGLRREHAKKLQDVIKRIREQGDE